MFNFMKKKATHGKFKWGWKKNSKVFDDWLIISDLKKEGYDYKAIGEMLIPPRDESYVRLIAGLKYNCERKIIE